MHTYNMIGLANSNWHKLPFLQAQYCDNSIFITLRQLNFIELVSWFFNILWLQSSNEFADDGAELYWACIHQRYRHTLTRMSPLFSLLWCLWALWLIIQKHSYLSSTSCRLASVCISAADSQSLRSVIQCYSYMTGCWPDTLLQPSEDWPQ